MNKRETLVPLKRGLFILRYVRARGAAGAPQVFVRPSVEAESYIEVISAPGDQPGVMVAPGSCMVVRADEAGTLRVTVRSDGGETDAELQLEPLGAGQAVIGGSQRELDQEVVPDRRFEEHQPRLE